MKLMTFTHLGETRVGVAVPEGVVDLRAVASGLPSEMSALLGAGETALDEVRSAAGAQSELLSWSEVEVQSPVLRPPKILAVGLNYADHIAETGMDKPKYPMIFNKQSTSAHPPHAPFHLPRASSRLDYEGELLSLIHI